MASREMKGKVFERNPRKTLAAIIVILLLGLEGGSFVVLAALSAAKAEYPYNRIISGYYINKNKPNYRFNTIKADATDADARLDEHGFYAAGPVSPEKPDDVVRVFVMGGSGAFGAGQHERFTDVYDYPKGVYTYSLSIAGQLK